VQGSDRDFQGLELTLRDYVAILLRHRWLVLGIFLASIVAAIAWTAVSPSRYESTATVVLRTNNNQQLFPSVGASQRSQFVRTPAAELEFANSSFFTADARAASPISSSVQPRYDEGDDRRSSELKFVATADDPFDSQDAALAWAELYLETRSASEVGQIDATIAGVEALVSELEREKDELLLPLKPIDDALLEETDSDTISRLTTQRLSLRQSLEDDLLPISLQLRTLSQDLSSLRIAAGFVTRPNISARLSIEPSPGRKVSPKVARNLALAPILGIMLAAGAALLNESFRGVINSDRDLAAVAPGVPVLTQLPEFGRRTDQPLDLAADPGTPYAQALERVVSSLLYERLLGSDQKMSVLVTSSVSGEGKTTLASHLALRLDATPATTILIDGDLRRPDVHIAYGQGQAERGLSHLLQAREDLGPHLHSLNRAKRVRALFAGAATDNAAALLRQAFPAAIESLKPLYDVLIVDAPPVLAVTDAEVMAHSVDGVLVAVRAGKTSRAQLTETMRKLAAVNAHVIGFVLVAVKSSVGYGYGYSYSYGYHSTGMGQLPYSAEFMDDQTEAAARENDELLRKNLRDRADRSSSNRSDLAATPPPASNGLVAAVRPEPDPPSHALEPAEPAETGATPESVDVAAVRRVPVSEKVAARRQAAKSGRERPENSPPKAPRVAPARQVVQPSPAVPLSSPWLEGLDEGAPTPRRTPRAWADAVTVRDNNGR